MTVRDASAELSAILREKMEEGGGRGGERGEERARRRGSKGQVVVGRSAVDLKALGKKDGGRKKKTSEGAADSKSVEGFDPRAFDGRFRVERLDVAPLPFPRSPRSISF